MADLVDALRMSAARTISASMLTEPIVGVVTKEEPLAISIDTKISLSGGKLILMKGLELEVNDKVLLIRASGGQKYYVIGEVA